MGFTVEQLCRALSMVSDAPLNSLQVVAAEEIARQYYPHLDPAQPALILHLADRTQAGRVQDTLMRAYPAAHIVVLVQDTNRRELPLDRLAQAADFVQPATLFIPPLARPSAYEALQDIAAHLRSPEGCPWDRELTWAKLRASLLEETYELLAALDANDATKVKEELGDLLLQISLQAQIATEEGRFRFGDVVAAIVEKLIRRHPHVFGDAVVSGTAEVLANWEAIKAAERQNNGEKRSPLAGIPQGLPALAQAEAYLDRMSRLAGRPVPAEPWAALANLPAGATVTAELLGEVLFELVAWAHARGLDAESALREANARFAAAVEA
ncbi:MAG: MazG family protein [Anaerolineae bacterium]|nr:MazG family protein [Anaerolineae bacterium]